MERNTFMSKKVFFLYPHSVIQKDLVHELVANEYAVYMVSDHKRFRSVVRDFNEPIVFVNIDENLTADEWKKYISELMESSDNTALIGILTYNDDVESAQTYLMDLMIQCGFIKLKLGLEQSKGIILKTLEANEAKGRRKYLRIECQGLSQTDLNVKIGERFHMGKIMDISSVGMAFVFKEPVELSARSLLTDIQLKLRGKIARVSGPVIGSRKDGSETIYVLLFDKTTTADTKERIHSFIYTTLQEEINDIMAAMT